jgi:hypothetical protein
MLGYAAAVVARVRAAEDRAAAAPAEPVTGTSTALVLADRAMVVRRECERAYPATRKLRITYTGTGYRDGYAEGQRADTGATRLPPARRPLPGPRS